jgi:hypothetical protein
MINGRKEGTREIRVILYAKDDPFCATVPADELSIEDVLAVEPNGAKLREIWDAFGAGVFGLRGPNRGGLAH